jgi:hydroxyacylglutathione hydrolase
MRKVYSVPILHDNYVHIPYNSETRECIIVDPGVSGPILDLITIRGLKPLAVLMTHHHEDHIGGANDLMNHFGIPGYAPALEKEQIIFADHFLGEGDVVEFLGTRFSVLQLSGHTRGHIGFWSPTEKWLFSGDVLFSMGCGRVFDGTLEQHFASLAKIRRLPTDTEIFCTHEYTENNLRFCLQNTPRTPALEKFEAKVHNLRMQNKPTVPFMLTQELALNPFLNAKSFADFKTLREKRDKF